MITFREITEGLDLEEAVDSQGQDPSAKAAELVARAFAARNAAHFAHLMTPSYAAHIALNEFYEGIIPLVDSFAESYIGRYGKFQMFPNVKESSPDGLSIVGNLTKWLDSNRATISDMSEIQNIIDEILSLCNSAAYKLRELK